MYSNSYELFKRVIVWLLIAWVTVAVAINPEPLVRINVDLENESSCTATEPEPLADDHEETLGGG
ncbi:hypothetical protein KFU94_14165 [Chloroflexi bacterium TSY]|nr:hypothetical protein [Chloroflexi bacterium TSY]MBV7329366.1 hypothetical protein [Chloroflexi bacterium TSY]